jgi:hypothetical protein
MQRMCWSIKHKLFLLMYVLLSCVCCIQVTWSSSNTIPFSWCIIDFVFTFSIKFKFKMTTQPTFKLLSPKLQHQLRPRGNLSQSTDDLILVTSRKRFQSPWGFTLGAKNVPSFSKCMNANAYISRSVPCLLLSVGMLHTTASSPWARWWPGHRQVCSWVGP